MPATTTSAGAWSAGSKIAYADPAAGDTVLKTTSLYFTSEFTGTGGQPPPQPYVDAPFLPSLDAAAVTVPALSALLGQNSAVIINLYLPYLQDGLDSHAGVFAVVSGTAPPLSFSAKASGGFAQPNITLSALSARKGLVSGIRRRRRQRASCDPAAVLRRRRRHSCSGRSTWAISSTLVAGRRRRGAERPGDPHPRRPEPAPPRRSSITVINWSPQLAPSPPATRG